MLNKLTHCDPYVIKLIIAALVITGALTVFKTLFFSRVAGRHAASVPASVMRPFVVTLSAYSAAGDENISLTVRYKEESEICKSIEPVIAVCKEMGIFGDIIISFLIEKNGVYYDSDELSIRLASDGSLAQITT